MSVWKVLRAPGALPAFIWAFLARLPVAMVPIGMVLYVQQIRGSYVDAGIISAGFTVGAAAGTPGWAALTDRRGQTRVLAGLSLAAAAALVGFTALVLTQVSLGVLILAAAVVGALRPPIPAAMRSCWKVLLPQQQLHAAFSLEAVAGEIVFITGPLLLSLVLGSGWAPAPLLVAAGLQAGGGLGFSFTSVARKWRPLPAAADHGLQRGASPVKVRAVQAVLLVTVCLGVGFGVFNTALAASASDSFHRPGLVGVLFMAVAGGSAVGGVVYGSRTWPGADRQRLLVSTVGFVLGLLVLSMVLAFPAPSIGLAALVLVGLGAPISAGLVMRSNLIDTYASPDRHNEAQSWLNTAHSAGSAAGAALAGVLLQKASPAVAMLAAGLAVALAWLVSLAAQRVWQPDKSEPGQNSGHLEMGEADAGEVRQQSSEPNSVRTEPVLV